ncbi:hypothetical protein E2C01_100633 [Portunus trituberculatus]|uniref:Uncharacterized protein n=1 Tax=Portunus trituberculatus TaxID=210409 RepID=A0A5B7KCQ0_PORTR|nr:hypothetical protein [Portunus trituberculatus]
MVFVFRVLQGRNEVEGVEEVERKIDSYVRGNEVEGSGASGGERNSVSKDTQTRSGVEEVEEMREGKEMVWNG